MNKCYVIEWMQNYWISIKYWMNTELLDKYKVMEWI